LWLLIVSTLLISFFFMKNITPRVMLQRALTLMLLGTVILMQSCSKESDSVTPQPTTERVAAPSSLDSLNNPSKTRSNYRFLSKSATSTRASAVIAIDPVSGPLGGQVNLFWSDFDYTPNGQHASPTAHIELTGPAHIIIPHANLKSYFGNTGSTNGFTFTIPPYVPTGSYTVHVTAEGLNPSLIHDSGYPDAEGTLTVTSATVTALSGLEATSTVTDVPPANPFTPVDTRNFNVNWPGQPYPAGTMVRFALQNSSGVYYLLARPNLLGITDNYPVGAIPSSMGNVFSANQQGTYATEDQVVTYFVYDIPGGTYSMYVDDYSTKYLYSTASATVTLP
jgi:hypothetical protein